METVFISEMLVSTCQTAAFSQLARSQYVCQFG